MGEVFVVKFRGVAPQKTTLVRWNATALELFEMNIETTILVA